MSIAKVENNRIELYRFIDGKTQERVITFLGGMLPEWNGETIQVLDWKLDPTSQTGKLTYQTRNDAYAPILGATLPLITERTKIEKPNRSKNWVWRESSELWQNTKTGECVKVY